jgi:hypothetical protein
VKRDDARSTGGRALPWPGGSRRSAHGITGMNGARSRMQRPRASGKIGDRVQVHGPGRICETPGCGTRLSIYNASLRCALHDEKEGAERRRTHHASRPVEERCCKHCGELFESSNVRHRYCQDSCQVSAFTVRKRREEAAAGLCLPLTELRTRLASSLQPPVLDQVAGSQARSRPPAAEPGKRGGAATHSSTRDVLHDGPRIRRFRQFCHCGRTLPARWTQSPYGMKAKQTRRPSCHNETQPDPFRAIQDPAFGLQNGCSRRVARRGEREKSLQMSGSAYGIRTRVTAVRGPSEGMPREDQRGAFGRRQSQQLLPFAAKSRAPFPNASQGSKSRTGDLGCRMVAAVGASHVMPGMQEEAAERIDAELRAAPAG